MNDGGTVFDKVWLCGGGEGSPASLSLSAGSQVHLPELGHLAD